MMPACRPLGGSPQDEPARQLRLVVSPPRSLAAALRALRPGDPCPVCGHPLSALKGTPGLLVCAACGSELERASAA